MHDAELRWVPGDSITVGILKCKSKVNGTTGRPPTIDRAVDGSKGELSSGSKAQQKTAETMSNVYRNAEKGKTSMKRKA
jgi:hypothetical protein